MFVEIVTPKKPLGAEKLYNRCYRGGEEITPEICMAVLKSTNYATCIKRMLLCVERLPDESQAGFKEVVLAAFSNREQPAAVKAVGERLAKAGGYEEEFKSAGRVFAVRTGYYESEPMAEMWMVLHNFTNDDLAQYERVKFVCDNVQIAFARKFPRFTDARMADVFFLSHLDMAGVEEIKLKPQSRFRLNYAKNVQAKIDTSKCESVCLRDVDVKGIEGLSFGENSRVWLYGRLGKQEEIDVSKCSEVTFEGQVKGLEFKDGATVRVVSYGVVPEDFDVSRCAEVILESCHLRDVKKLAFRDGAVVNLAGADGLPETLDFSMCKEVNLYATDMTGVQELKFRDKKQEGECNTDFMENFSGRISYSGGENVVTNLKGAFSRLFGTKGR